MNIYAADPPVNNIQTGCSSCVKKRSTNVDHVGLEPEGEPEGTRRRYEYHILTDTNRQAISQEIQSVRTASKKKRSISESPEGVHPVFPCREAKEVKSRALNIVSPLSLSLSLSLSHTHTHSYTQAKLWPTL